MFSKIKIFYNQRLTRKTRLFLKSFSITILAVSIIVIAVVVALDILIAPPNQSEVIAAPSDSPDRPVVDDDGFLIVNPNPGDEYDEYDEYPWPTYNAPSWAVDRREYFWTFLIIGLNEGINANTVMVASYCGITREANLISIPRDIPVHPTRNGRKLSSSYMIGAGGGRGIAGGVAQMQRDVQTVIGFIPDFYVVIDYDTFFTIIDAVGGIYIDVPIRMRYDDPYQNLRIDIQPGLQHMDGETALLFSRFRQANRNSGYPSLPDGDLGRIRNQQAVISAVISQLLRVENLNPVRINEFVNIFNDSVHTNISFRDMPFFANELRHINGVDALSTHTFPTHAATVNDISYLFLMPSTVVELLNRTVNPFDGVISANDLRIVRP